jgi:hypothetical protein
VDWLIRKAKYQGYITFDKDTGKTGFLLTINKLKRKHNKEESKTKLLSILMSKTNEATKIVSL